MRTRAVGSCQTSCSATYAASHCHWLRDRDHILCVRLFFCFCRLPAAIFPGWLTLCGPQTAARMRGCVACWPSGCCRLDLRATMERCCGRWALAGASRPALIVPLTVDSCNAHTQQVGFVSCWVLGLCRAVSAYACHNRCDVQRMSQHSPTGLRSLLGEVLGSVGHLLQAFSGSCQCFNLLGPMRGVCPMIGCRCFLWAQALLQSSGSTCRKQVCACK